MLTPEQAQKITDLRSFMLRNVAAGKPSYEGLSEDQLKEALSFVRSNRSASVTAAAKKKDGATKTTRGKKEKPKVVVDFASFTNMDLD